MSAQRLVPQDRQAAAIAHTVHAELAQCTGSQMHLHSHYVPMLAPVTAGACLAGSQISMTKRNTPGCSTLML